MYGLVLYCCIWKIFDILKLNYPNVEVFAEMHEAFNYSDATIALFLGNLIRKQRQMIRKNEQLYESILSYKAVFKTEEQFQIWIDEFNHKHHCDIVRDEPYSKEFEQIMMLRNKYGISKKTVKDYLRSLNNSSVEVLNGHTYRINFVFEPFSAKIVLSESDIDHIIDVAALPNQLSGAQADFYFRFHETKDMKVVKSMTIEDRVTRSSYSLQNDEDVKIFYDTLLFVKQKYKNTAD